MALSSVYAFKAARKQRFCATFTLKPGMVAGHDKNGYFVFTNRLSPAGGVYVYRARRDSWILNPEWSETVEEVLRRFGVPHWKPDIGDDGPHSPMAQVRNPSNARVFK